MASDVKIDWDQVRRNGGPPCFHPEAEGKFCLRAERWAGHEHWHKFLSLERLMQMRNKEALIKGGFDV